jgi:nicotinamidase-related amidase
MASRFLFVLGFSGWVLSGLSGRGEDNAPLRFTQRYRLPAENGGYEIRAKEVAWQPAETALIICDMWDAHHCLNAVRRVEELVPVMNRVVEKARSQGVLIVHAPSSCMEPYKDHPARKRAQAAPPAKNLPKDIHAWCDKIPAEEKGKYPIDQMDGGEDDDPAEHAKWAAALAAKGLNPRAPWKSQHAGIKIHDVDAISDSGVEIWNLFEQRGIKNVILVGVHTNMCVLGRPFGLRQMAKNGKNAVLIRDMTDTMYNPQRAPYVSHFRGTELIVEHIEKFVCPTITSDQLIGGKMFRFKGDGA